MVAASEAQAAALAGRGPGRVRVSWDPGTELFAFDLDGTLVRSFMREGGGGASQDYDLVELLPGRAERIQALAHDGARFALVTNQGGVAFGYQTVGQVHAKIGRIMGAFSGFHAAPVSVHVAFGHESAKVMEYQDPGAVRRRKPSPVMLVEALLTHRVRPERAVFVGDMASDEECARNAGVRYVDAEEFFDGA